MWESSYSRKCKWSSQRKRRVSSEGFWPSCPSLEWPTMTEATKATLLERKTKGGEKRDLSFPEKKEESFIGNRIRNLKYSFGGDVYTSF